MFNSREYEWADVSVIMAGRDVTGIRAVKYSPSQEKEPLYAKGNKPHGIQRGNKSYSGTITLLQSELEALETAAGGDALDISFNVVVAYGNPLRGDVIKTDLLVGVEITEIPKGMAQNDKFMEIEIPIIMMDVKRNYI
ncbi:hypothetical protein B5F83_01040 [Muribaculum sp. An289]|uniref:hypothetical protein n=1 Tax=unclassified Muribaculum TaxID=2622126 RepID=UPI000B37E52A|nr:MULTISPECIES: hypothetical protein [unclassified Muribaculum]OUO38480.1 hypothetical protein B5F83_01040 [Muribaculum sp. An289]OUO43971.1 hypothetical protein B5F81_02015 [Muribaculum sp. An287]